ncbi:anti-sigma factor [Pelomonas sp. CA6]|uniref:anti-sigma factor family protein n=1 Tax=Pelomonas sp. CA6 TaxID=2907999 RepID=UPI001F4B8D5F|nr:anti-sigma factor [Pelomonas sp. CA6]MCH7341871.1 anti-sigma factor [Pelomonas sp. CA6]
MNSDFRPDESLLHAFVDGELEPATAARVAQWLDQHPDQAERVLAWRTQRGALQGLALEVLDEPLPQRLRDALDGTAAARPARWHATQAWAASLMLLALGLGGGWGAHAWWSSTQRLAPPLARAPDPGFVRDAAIAHVLYQPEQRHPVEVGADQQAHLVAWLSKRLGQPLRVPDLSDQGLRLVGGRLLPAGDGAAASASAPAALARAQFMYEDREGHRLTLYVATAAGTDAPPAFRISAGPPGPDGQSLASFYWVEGPLAYALSGPLDAARLTRLGSLVYARLKT